MSVQMNVIGEKIVENRIKISALALEYRMEDNPEIVEKIKSRKLRSLTEQEAEEFGSTFVKYLGEAVYGEEQLYFDLITEWSRKAGEIAVREGIPLEESLDGLRFFRKAILTIIKQEAEKSSLAVEGVIDAISIIDPLIDRCIYCYSHVYIEEHQEEMTKAYANIQELLMPIVPITNGIAVLPIIGQMNEERSQYILEKTLEESKRHQLSHLIIDLSGIAIIDTMVAHNLNSIFNALQLLGVQPILTGMRAELTQTVVSLGINFKDIATFRSLQMALESIGFIQNTTYSR
ncbi:STAS domain-containing protein [Halobacillus sp. BBL2006]|uniref:STAS domain-containing protein n=1 Tax=Halobacillus sp. BBL2006 TaxID=1543706 RepID=UPI000541B9E7|nr:STAS domain-containing protein [Halobacillus sp. BBL2006]KHE72971.1 hypothetical protein LD39_01735 [Halobacillus sp. BBL2006]